MKLFRIVSETVRVLRNPEGFSDSLKCLLVLQTITGMSSYKLKKSSITGRYYVAASIPGMSFTFAHLTIYLICFVKVYASAWRYSMKKGFDVRFYTFIFTGYVFGITSFILIGSALLCRARLVIMADLMTRLDSIFGEIDRLYIYRKVTNAVSFIAILFTGISIVMVTIIIKVLITKRFAPERIILLVLTPLYATMEVVAFISYNKLIFWSSIKLHSILDVNSEVENEIDE